jgi:hypothetical protein
VVSSSTLTLIPHYSARLWAPGSRIQSSISLTDIRIVFFVGALQASIVWRREHLELQNYLKGKQVQFRGASGAVAYGTFSDDEQGMDGLIRDGP